MRTELPRRRATRGAGTPPPAGVLRDTTASILQFNGPHYNGIIKVNGCPIELLEPETLRLKTYEPVLLLGPAKFANVDIRVRVKGGGFTAQIYAIRQAIAKSLVAYYQKYVDEASKTEIRTLNPITFTKLRRHPDGVRPNPLGGGPGAVVARPRNLAATPRARATRSRTVKRIFISSDPISISLTFQLLARRRDRTLV